MTQLPSLKLCKQINNDICKIIEKVSQYIIPSKQMEIELSKISTSILETIKNQLDPLKEKYGYDRIELHGSVAKGTWLPSQIDFDIFIVFKQQVEREKLEALISEAAGYLKVETQKRYSEHPYLRLRFPNGYEADLVPAFDFNGKKYLTATDRTIYHTRYVNDHMTPELRNECRLLKSFLKGINAYGAEIKIGGFSGYSAELLIIKFKSFIETLKFISKNEKISITLTEHKPNWQKLHEKYNTDYILLDPVDPKRNVLAALTPQTYNTTRIASKLFLYKPSLNFFHVTQKTIETPELIKITDRYIYTVTIKPKPETPPDTIWGITKKTQKQLTKKIQENDIQVIYTGTEEDPTGNIYIIIETNQPKTHPYKKIKGPPSSAPPQQISKFIKKHKNNPAGPWIENNRIVTIKKTKEKTIEQLLQENLKQTQTKYKKYIETITIEKTTKTNNPAIIKHIKRKPKWLT